MIYFHSQPCVSHLQHQVKAVIAGAGYSSGFLVLVTVNGLKTFFQKAFLNSCIMCSCSARVRPRHKKWLLLHIRWREGIKAGSMDGGASGLSDGRTGS